MLQTLNDKMENNNYDIVRDNNRIYFDEPSHTYTDSRGNVYTSVTTLLGKYHNKFDKRKWLKIKSAELGVSERELEKQWADITEESCVRGTAQHGYLEDGIKQTSKFYKAIQYLHKEDKEMVTMYDIGRLGVEPLNIKEFIDATENKYPEIYKVFQYYIDNGYKIYSEIGVFLSSFLVSGCIDVPCIRNDKFVILDWKTNRRGVSFEAGYYKKDKNQIPHQITNKWVRTYEKMKPPVHYLEDCNGIHYSLQLSMYARITEEMLGIPCAGIALAHIGSPFELNEYGMPRSDKEGRYSIIENGIETVTWHKCKYYRNEAEAILKDRYLEIAGSLNNQLSLF